jgi:glycogenin glucosyltransferase
MPTSKHTARAPPPADSGPEASNFPVTHYEMSHDSTPFKAPERYPEPPTGMYYEVPKTPTYQKPAPIFPWEKDAPKPSRVFAEDNVYQGPVSSGSAVVTEDEKEKDEPVTPTTPIISIDSADPWQSIHSRTNAWDDIPEIERYIGALQKNRKGNIQVLQGYGSGLPEVSSPGGRRPSMKLTDFPTELERPSLPVTPAPVRRPSFWGEERDEEGELPAAEGVPAQADWVSLLCDRCRPIILTITQDPAAQLEMLARRQSDVLTNKLGQGTDRDIPQRSLPYGSEGVKSPTYTPQAPGQTSAADAEALSESVPMQQPSFQGPGSAWEKDETYLRRETPLPPSEEEKDVLET